MFLLDFTETILNTFILTINVTVISISLTTFLLTASVAMAFDHFKSYNLFKLFRSTFRLAGQDITFSM